MIYIMIYIYDIYIYTCLCSKKHTHIYVYIDIDIDIDIDTSFWGPKHSFFSLTIAGQIRQGGARGDAGGALTCAFIEAS
jgi:hypothetical protein